MAESVGVESENIFILNNGDVVDIRNGAARQTRNVSAGDVFVDGLGIGDVGRVVLRDRKVLAEEGMLIIVVSMSKRAVNLFRIQTQYHEASSLSVTPKGSIKK